VNEQLAEQVEQLTDALRSEASARAMGPGGAAAQPSAPMPPPVAGGY
jgi:hypothetical protein